MCLSVWVLHWFSIGVSLSSFIGYRSFFQCCYQCDQCCWKFFLGKAISAISLIISVHYHLLLSVCHVLRLEQVWSVLWRCWRWWKHLWMSQTTRCGVTWAVIWVFCPLCSHTLTSTRTSRSSSEISSLLSAWSWAGTAKLERVRARTHNSWRDSSPKN